MAPIIVGAGVIGASISYYLAQKGQTCLVLEAVGPACSSSGKAGGFLALDWNSRTRVDELARASFHLHAQLAQTLGAEALGYRRMRTHSLTMQTEGAAQQKTRRQSGAGGGHLPAWVSRDKVEQSTKIADTDTTAQVNPAQLTRTLLQRAQEKGASLRLTQVVGLEVEGRRVTALKVRDKGSQEESMLPVADNVVFTMGVWSDQLRQWLPDTAMMPEITGLKVHSIVLDDKESKTSPDALFLLYKDGLEPEVYPRPNSEVYVCGVSEEVKPPPTADQIRVRPEAVETLRGVAASVSKDLAGAELKAANACFLPCTGDGMPVIGRIPGLDNAWVATGHSCWGILNAPATGLAMAELLTEGTSRTINVGHFDPSRFSRLSFEG